LHFSPCVNLIFNPAFSSSSTNESHSFLFFESPSIEPDIFIVFVSFVVFFSQITVASGSFSVFWQKLKVILP
jgi:hypothetical protein